MKSYFPILFTRLRSAMFAFSICVSSNAQTVKDGNGTIAAQTLWQYDLGALQSEPNIVGLDPSVTILGNPTTVSRWLKLNGSFLNTNAVYDVAGNVVQIADPLNNLTTFAYADPNNTYAAPTTVTNPLGQAATYQYDYNTGKQTASTDANQAQTAYAYSDPLDRLTTIRRAAGSLIDSCMGAAETQTSYTYPSVTTMTTRQDLTSCGDLAMVNTVVYDGLGREAQRQTGIPGGVIEVDTSYDAIGRVYQVSNPHQPGVEASHSTTYSYDSLSRIRTQATDDGSTTTTNYSGNSTTVFDPASVSRTTITDALGRLTSVTEAAGGASYTYDTRDDLTGVNHSGEVRSFAYDSLKRLLCASNPESRAGVASCQSSPLPASGVDLYSYDAGGNLIGHTDARGVATSSAYDKLNRIIAKSYSDGTPNVVFCYDGNTTAANYNGSITVACTGAQTLANVNATGRLTWESNANSSAAFTAFDPLGRVLNSAQITAGVSYKFSYGYDRAGDLVSERYPSGRTIATSYDVAARPTQVASGATTYVSGVQYSSHGPVKSATLGNGVTETWTFDPLRLQPLKLAATLGSITLDLKYYYCAGQQPPNAPSPCGSNNGNLRAAGISVTAGINVTQSYGYDGSNRLLSANENNGANWAQTYSYDAWGNRAVAGTMWNPAWTPTNISQYANNRWIRGAGDQYDAAGNQTAVASDQSVNTAASTFGYDAENRLVQANVGNTGAVSYRYDGEGRRVRKTVGGQTTAYVYDAAGRLAAEYSTQLPVIAGTAYLTADALGSTRLVSDASGVRLYDYLPFGEEVPSGMGGRSAQYPAARYPSGPDAEYLDA